MAYPSQYRAGHVMRRVLTTLSLLLLASIILAGGILLGTESGLRWSVRQLESATHGTLHVGSVQGRLLGGIRVRNLRYRDPHNELRIEYLRLRWQPRALLQRQLRIVSLEASGISLQQKGEKKAQGAFQGFSLPLTLQLEQASLTRLRYQKEENEPLLLHEIHLRGSFRQTTLTLQQLEISMPQGELQAEGRLETVAELPFDITSSWHWNAPPDAPVGASGTLRIEGTPQQYRFEATASLPSERFSPAQMKIEGSGDLTQLRVDRLLARWLDGEWRGSGRLQWQPALKWEASLAADAVDPSRAWKAWPGGRIGLSLTGQGDSEKSQVELDRLRGEVRGYPLSARGKFRFSAGVLRMEQVRLDSGSARFTASGSLGERWDTRWRLNAPDLGHLWPELAGSLEASGTVSGHRMEPNFRVQLDGKDIRWRQYLVERTQGDLKIGLQKKEPWAIDARLDGIQAGKLRLQRFSITGEGFTRDHRLQLRLVRDESTRMHSEIRGELKEGEWHALLEGGELVLPELHWRQQESAELRLGKSAASLSPWCWQHEAARICLEGRRAGNGWLADLTMERLDLAWLQPWVPRNDLFVTGLAEGNAHISYRDGRLDGSRANLRLYQGGLDYLLAEEDRYRVAYREIALRMDKRPEALEASLEADLQKTGKVRGSWQLPQWSLSSATAEEQPVAGRLTLQLEDLSLLALLVPRIQQPAGKVVGDLSFGGSLGTPRLDGRIRLEEGSVTLPDLGISLQKIALLAETRQGSRLALQGSARSGTGTLTLAGELDFSSLSQWQSWLSLKGTKVEVARLPEARVIASPDLMVRVRPHIVQLSGHVEIPHAKIKLPEKQGLVPVSPDVVVVGGEESETPRKRWQIATTIALKLGEKVEVRGHGFEGRISGQLAIIEAPDRPAIAQGELEIHDGSYKIYGQKLSIDEGRLLYAASPLTNPGLQFRVVRRQRDVEAGILVFGRLKKPQLQLFSTPPMDDSDILAYILIGKPLREATTSEGDRVSQAARSLQLAGGTWLAKRLGKELDIEEVSIESGAGDDTASLVLGKYLSPRLYVQYIIGLTEGGNILRARYQINQNWILESESGIHSGVDLLFTLER